MLGGVYVFVQVAVKILSVSTCIDDNPYHVGLSGLVARLTAM